MAIAEAAAAGVALSQYARLETRQSVAPEPRGVGLIGLFGSPEAYWLGLLDAITVTGVSR
jgi:hypothetical protein